MALPTTVRINNKSINQSIYLFIEVFQCKKVQFKEVCMYYNNCRTRCPTDLQHLCCKALINK